MYELYSLQVVDCAEEMVRAEITHSSSHILWLFFISFEDPANAPSDLRPTHLTVLLTNVINSRRAAPPWRHLIIEKRQETYSFFIPPTLPPRLPSVPHPLIPPAVSGASVRCTEWRCACVGERGERCTLLRTGSAGHHRVTALDNRVVVEGETGPGPGAGVGPGEAPWLFIARSPKTCPSFFCSPS